MPPFVLSLLLNKYTYIIASIFAVIFYIFILRYEVSNLREENTQLTVALKEEKAALIELQKDHEQIIKAKDDLIAQNNKLLATEQALEKKLNKKIPLDAMAAAHSKLIENDINRGTQTVLKCFEILSNGGSC